VKSEKQPGESERGETNRLGFVLSRCILCQ
jgi:hypothetical protein